MLRNSLTSNIRAAPRDKEVDHPSLIPFANNPPPHPSPFVPDPAPVPMPGNVSPKRPSSRHNVPHSRRRVLSTTTDRHDYQTLRWKKDPVRRMAGRLRHHLPTWRRLTDSPFVLQAVTGYHLEFISKPPLMPRHTAGKLKTAIRGQAAGFMDKEIKSLLQKGAIERAPKGPGFFSRMFLVPKADGAMRPIINLKPLNKHISAPHFTMTTVKDVFQLLQTGRYAWT